MLRLRVALVVAVFAACAVIALVLRPLADGEDVPVIPTPPGGQRREAVEDPFAWTPERTDDLTRRAAAGTGHLLYTRSPGGAVATAERVARRRPQVERAANAAGVSPDRLEALVFLESAGRPGARAPGAIEGAAGLMQILAETATACWACRSTSSAAAATRAAWSARCGGATWSGWPRWTARGGASTTASTPHKALGGTARYLKLARERFGREDLAFVSYHMGIGNLEGVLERFGSGRRSYAELYFDSTPLRHRRAYQRLASFGDDSSNYYWKLGAAIEIMRLARSDQGRLARLAALQTGDDSARRVLLDGAPRSELRTLSGDVADTSLEAAPGVRLRPEALAAALYMAAEVRTISGAPALRVTGARDGGWTFLVSRRYASEDQALAFQYVLDRLQVLNAIAWSRSARTIHVTASREAEVLEPLLDRLGGSTK